MQITLDEVIRVLFLAGVSVQKIHDNTPDLGRSPELLLTIHFNNHLAEKGDTDL